MVLLYDLIFHFSHSLGAGPISVCIDTLHYCFLILSQMLGETMKVVYCIFPNTDNATLNIFVQFSLCRETPGSRVTGQRTRAFDIWIGPLIAL